MQDDLFNHQVINAAHEKSIREEGLIEGINIGEARGIAIGRSNILDSLIVQGIITQEIANQQMVMGQ